jgi:acyl-coenzyme A thioesterase PaaI-like protein
MPLSTTARDVSLAFAAGTLVGIASMAFFERRCGKRRRRQQSTLISCPSASDLPPFAHELAHNPDLHRIRLREWEDLEWRAKNGWKGHDLCHNHNEQQGGNAVRVLQYYFDEANTQMTGVVWFGPDAESHRGLCHGGAMSSLMDDFCGHMAFVDKPWSGATVQVNVSLKKPVKVGSVLRIHGRIRKKEGRKVHVEAVLDDGAANDPVVYAVLEGLSIDGVKLSDHQDEVAERTWEVDVCKTSGRLQRQDSGWNKDE